jgi:hypothetical protein
VNEQKVRKFVLRCKMERWIIWFLTVVALLIVVWSCRPSAWSLTIFAILLAYSALIGIIHPLMVKREPRYLDAESSAAKRVTSRGRMLADRRRLNVKFLVERVPHDRHNAMAAISYTRGEHVVVVNILAAEHVSDQALDYLLSHELRHTTDRISMLMVIQLLVNVGIVIFLVREILWQFASGALSSSSVSYFAFMLNIGLVSFVAMIGAAASIYVVRTTEMMVDVLACHDLGSIAPALDFLENPTVRRETKKQLYKLLHPNKERTIRVLQSLL